MDMATQFLGKVPNCMAPGPDMVQGFWLKNFTGYTTVWKASLDCESIPGWMTKGRTVLGMRPCRGMGGPRSLVGILKCLVSAFCQGFTLLLEIE